MAILWDCGNMLYVYTERGFGEDLRSQAVMFECLSVVYFMYVCVNSN